MGSRERRSFTPGYKSAADERLKEAGAGYGRVSADLGIAATQLKTRYKGNCLDNVPMESFFGSLKTELTHRTRFRIREQPRHAIFGYIEVLYNRKRRHSSLGYILPPQQAMRNFIAEGKIAHD